MKVLPTTGRSDRPCKTSASRVKTHFAARTLLSRSLEKNIPSGRSLGGFDYEHDGLFTLAVGPDDRVEAPPSCVVTGAALGSDQSGGGAEVGASGTAPTRALVRICWAPAPPGSAAQAARPHPECPKHNPETYHAKKANLDIGR